jgi:cytochrome c-type biogenesis protein CcmF
MPFAGSLGITAVWGYLHRMHPASIFGLWLVSFVLLAIGTEFWKGIRARMAGKAENPLVAFGKLVGRNHRRYGGYIIHLGIVLIALGIVGDAYFKQETQGTLARGESLKLGEYELRFEGLRAYNGSDGREVHEAQASLFQDGQFIRSLTPRRDYFVVQEQPVSIASVHSTPGADVYVLLLEWKNSGASATFKMYFNPLINWVWIGGLVMILGTIIAAWPAKKGEREISYSLKPSASRLQPSPGD